MTPPHFSPHPWSNRPNSFPQPQKHPATQGPDSQHFLRRLINAEASSNSLASGEIPELVNQRSRELRRHVGWLYQTRSPNRCLLAPPANCPPAALRSTRQRAITPPINLELTQARLDEITAKAVCCLLLCDGLPKTCPSLRTTRGNSRGAGKPPRYAPSLPRAHTEKKEANMILVMPPSADSPQTDILCAALVGASPPLPPPAYGTYSKYCTVNTVANALPHRRATGRHPRGSPTVEVPPVKGSRVASQRNGDEPIDPIDTSLQSAEHGSWQ